MKRLILSTAIILGGLTAVTAQNDKEVAALNKATQTVEAKAPSLISAVQDYTEVKVSDLPQSVIDAIGDDFDGATISKAYVNAQGEYKLQLATTDQKNATVYADAKGMLVKNELKKQ